MGKANTPWTLNSVYAAADGFAARVARRPQRTWAILTKYRANRSFVAQTDKLAFSPLEYDLVATFTSSLFDNYMDYKSLIKNLQDMMANPGDYQEVVKANAIPLEVDTLVAVRAAISTEMNKIVQAVDILTKDPHMLKRSGKLKTDSTNDLVKRIIEQSMKTVKPKDEDTFWDWEMPDNRELLDPDTFSWPVEGDKKRNVSGKTESNSNQAVDDSRTAPEGTETPEPKTRQQWVWVDALAVPEDDTAITIPVPSAERVEGWYPAWVESTTRTFDLTTVPTGMFDAKNGAKGWAYVFDFAGSGSSDKGSWEIGEVEEAQEPAIQAALELQSTSVAQVVKDTTPGKDKSPDVLNVVSSSADASNTTSTSPTPRSSEGAEATKVTTSGTTKVTRPADFTPSQHRDIPEVPTARQEQKPTRNPKTNTTPAVNFDLLVSSISVLPECLVAVSH